MKFQVIYLLMLAVLVVGNYPGELNTGFTESEATDCTDSDTTDNNDTEDADTNDTELTNIDIPAFSDTRPNVPETTDSNDTILFYPSRPEAQLYYDVSLEYYDHAFTLVNDFLKYDAGLIKQAIDKLVEDRRINVATFAYKLFAAGYRKVVEELFPPQYRMVFNDTRLKFTNNMYPLDLEFDPRTDLAGDQDLYGNEKGRSFDNYVWKLDPVEDGKKIFFKIRHLKAKRYLKLGKYSDRNGSHQTYGSTDSDTGRHQWMLQPIFFKGLLSFCIINREYYQSLKFGSKAEYGRRYVYSMGGNFFNYVEEHGWQVGVIKDYSFLNQ